MSVDKVERICFFEKFPVNVQQDLLSYGIYGINDK